MLMQGVLCLILCGSVGLTALVKHVHLLNGPSLAGIRYVNGVGLKAPAGWIFQRENQGLVLFVVVEPDSQDKKGRRLIIRKEKTDPSISPEDYLESSGLFSGPIRLIPADPSANLARPITIAGLPGVMLPVRKHVVGIPFLIDPVNETDFFAASVRPSGTAVSLQLECPDESDPQDDLELLYTVAAAMDVQDSPTGR